LPNNKVPQSKKLVSADTPLHACEVLYFYGFALADSEESNHVATESKLSALPLLTAFFCGMKQTCGIR
jgi:hypothetical protein